MTVLIGGEFGVNTGLYGLTQILQFLPHHVHLDLVLFVLVREGKCAFSQKLEIGIKLDLLLIDSINFRLNLRREGLESRTIQESLSQFPFGC